MTPAKGVRDPRNQAATGCEHWMSVSRVGTADTRRTWYIPLAIKQRLKRCPARPLQATPVERDTRPSHPSSYRLGALDECPAGWYRLRSREDTGPSQAGAACASRGRYIRRPGKGALVSHIRAPAGCQYLIIVPRVGTGDALGRGATLPHSSSGGMSVLLERCIRQPRMGRCFPLERNSGFDPE